MDFSEKDTDYTDPVKQNLTGSGVADSEDGDADAGEDALTEAEASENSFDRDEAAGIPEGLSVEDAFAQLQQILDRMDAGDVSLEESFKCYERGMKLIRYCNETIDRVEKKVRILSAEGEPYEF